jgi:hypothetical protein
VVGNFGDAVGVRVPGPSGDIDVLIGVNLAGSVDPAVLRTNVPGVHYGIELSGLLPQAQITRALAHELAEIVARQSGVATTDGAHPSPNHDQPTQLTAHYQGRIAEMTVLLDELHAPGNTNRGASMNDLLALRDAIGMNPTNPQAGMRRGWLDPNLASRLQAAETYPQLAAIPQSPTFDQIVGLSRLQRPATELVALANLTGPTGHLTLQQLADLDGIATADIQQVHAKVPDVAQLHQVLTADGIDPAHAAAFAGSPLVTGRADMLALHGLARPDPDLAMLLAGAVPPLGAPTALADLAAIDRFTSNEVSDLIQVPAYASWPNLVAVGRLGRSAADLVALGTAQDTTGATPTVPQVTTLEPLSNPDIDLLRALPQVGTHDNTTRLVGLQRTPADTAALAARADTAGVTPTLQQLIDLDAFRPAELDVVLAKTGTFARAQQLITADGMTAADVLALARQPQVTSYADIVALHRLNRPNADIVTLLTGGVPALGKPTTVQEIVDIDRFTSPEVGQLVTIPAFASYAALARLAPLARSAPDLVALGQGALTGGNQPTVDQIVALERLDNATLQQLAQRPAVASDVAQLVRLAALTRSPADLLALSALTDANGTLPTVDQMVALDALTLADIHALAGLPQVTTYQHIQTLSNLTAPQRAALMALPAGNLRDATTLIAMEPVGSIEQNTAMRVLNGDVVAYDLASCVPHPNAATLLPAWGYSPAQYQLLINPSNGQPMLWMNGADGCQPSPGVMILDGATANLPRIIELLLHETNHARNTPASGSAIDMYKEEFRAYWVSEFRHHPVATRAAAIKQHILSGYPHIANDYHSNPAVRAQIDAYVAPQPGDNMDNS